MPPVQPLFLTADHLEGETELETRARGNVELRKPDLLLLADRLNYRPLDDEAEAIGQVHLKQGAAEIDTEYLKIRLTEQIGHTEAARYQIERSVQNKFYDNTRVTPQPSRARLMQRAGIDPFTESSSRP